VNRGKGGTMKLTVSIQQGEPRVSSKDLAVLLGWEPLRLAKVIDRDYYFLANMGEHLRHGFVSFLNHAQALHLVEVAQMPQVRDELERAFRAHGSLTSPFDRLRREDGRGEYWMARELMGLLGYTKWQNFEEAIERAMAASDNAGQPSSNHITAAGNMVSRAQGGGRELTDYRLSRYACYLVAMNGDPRKPEIAKAQTYFAVQTRRAELEQPTPKSSLELLELALNALKEHNAGLIELRGDVSSLKTETQAIAKRTQSLHFRPDLALEVRNHIGRLCRVSGISFSEAYRDLYAKFKVNEYKALTEEQYPEVIQYLSARITGYEVQGRLA
jgi:hypothetical protein